MISTGMKAFPLDPTPGDDICELCSFAHCITPSPGDDICERSSRGGTFRPHSDHATSHYSQGIPRTAEQKRLIGFVFASRLFGSLFPAPTSHRARIFNLLRSPEIDFKESISPAYVASSDSVPAWNKTSKKGSTFFEKFSYDICSKTMEARLKEVFVFSDNYIGLWELFEFTGFI
jgi:hypothetical protein